MPYINGSWINDSGTWRVARKLYVNDNGTWRFVKQAWVNDSGTWRRYHAMPDITWDTEYNSGNLTWTSRDTMPANGTGYWKYDSTNGWMTKAYVYQSSGGFSTTTSYVVGSTSAAANQADIYVCVPTSTSVVSTPSVSCQGDHFSNQWFAYWDYETAYPTVNNVTSTPSGWRSC